MQGWGKYTVHGTAELEQRIRELVCDVASTVKSHVKQSQYRSLVLLGGYGRGEGGVELRDGVEHPHNNLDFLLITQGMGQSKQAACRERIDEALAPIRERFGVGVDFSTIDIGKLKRSPCLVMWYDMRFGHRTVLGDAEFVPSLTQFSVDKIPAWNILDLLVNRGTLLVINDLLLERAAPGNDVSRAMLRHIIKGIIGYGDALLFFADKYHWSYAEKGRRMQSCSVAPESLQEIYGQAIDFRFQPDYERFPKRDPGQWMTQLRDVLNAAHLHCERQRLGKPDIDWETYVNEALKQSLWSDLRSPRAAVKKTLNIWRGPRCRVNGSTLASLGGRLTGMQGLLRILFPVVAYQLESPNLRETAASALGAEDTSVSELRRCYLKHWGRFGDDNFGGFLNKYGVSLDREEQLA